jgi:hypothetical protein
MRDELLVADLVVDRGKVGLLFRAPADAGRNSVIDRDRPRERQSLEFQRSPSFVAHWRLMQLFPLLNSLPRNLFVSNMICGPSGFFDTLERPLYILAARREPGRLRLQQRDGFVDLLLCRQSHRRATPVSGTRFSR